MRVGKMIALASLLALAGALLAQNNDYTPDPNWKAPPPAARRTNPLAKTPNAAQQGKDIFEAQCSMCHGFDGSGLANAANLRMPAVQKQSDGTLFWKITTGHQQRGMPSFQRLPDNERWQLVSYLRTFNRR